MSEKAIRRKFMRRFVGMTKYSRWYAWLMVSFFVVQILGGILAGHYLLSNPSSGLTITLMILTSVFIGTRLRGLNNIVHECTHFTFSDHRQDNVVIGSLCASILTGCFRQYRDEHMSHHAHLGDYEHDMDLKGIQDLRLHEALTTATIIRHLTNPLLGRHLRQYSGINLSAGDGVFFQRFKIVMLVSIFFFTIIEPYTALAFVLIPLFYVLPTINYWTDCLDHGGIVSSEDGLDSSRNILAPLPLKLFFFPRNDCFHLVHHLFPQVPARHLESAHGELSKESTYQNLENAMRPTRHSHSQLVSDVS